MRCSELRAKIITAITGATPDSVLHLRDVFRVANLGFRDISTATDRMCILNLSAPPARAGVLIPQDLFTVTWELAVLYHESNEIQDRIADDAERLAQALEAMPGLYDDVIQVELAAVGITEDEGLVISEFSLTTDYRLTAGV